MKGSLIIVLIVGVIVVSYNIINNNNRVRIELDSCVDGDTAWFIIDGNREKVRLLGIDTPESTNYVEKYGMDASKYTCDMLEGARDIYIEFDINSKKRDKYDRLLGYIFVDGDNLGELLLSKGLAEVKYVYGDYKYIDDFCDIQSIAYLNKLGIWNIYDIKNNYCYDVE